MAKVKLMQVSTLKCPFPLLFQSEMYLVHHSTSIYHSILQYITVYQSSSIYHSISQNIRISECITVYQSTLQYITEYQVYQYITVHPPLLQHEMQCITVYLKMHCISDQLHVKLGRLHSTAAYFQISSRKQSKQ